MPSKSTPFTPSSILFRPRRSPSGSCGLGFGWRRRVLPPGPKGLLRRPFIAIAGLRRHPQYRRERLTKKERPCDESGRSATSLGAHAPIRQIGWSAAPTTAKSADHVRTDARAIRRQRRPTLLELFIAFAIISLSGFGGVLAWSRRMVVERAQMDDGGGVQRGLCALPVPAGAQHRQPLGRVRLAHPRAAGRGWSRWSD